MAADPGGARESRHDECREDLFIARKPIFNHLLSVEGYELTFHQGQADSGDADVADMIGPLIKGGFLLDEIDALRGGRSAFIGATRELLVGDAVWALPPARTVLQVTRSIEPDGEVLEACRQLRQKGYRIALDAYRLNQGRDAFLPVVDLAKMDVVEPESKEWTRALRHLSRAKVTGLANQVESIELFQKTLALGCRFFQGSFFARPALVPYWDVPASKLRCLRILEDVLQPELDFDDLENEIESDLALSYKLLRYIQSAYFGVHGSVKSMREALMFLGEIQIRNWASVVALAGMTSNKPEEVLNEALIRGRFCELLAAPAGMAVRAPELFIAGMFTLLDAIMDRPLAEVLEGIPIEDDIKAALLGAPCPVRDVIDVVIFYMSGDWDSMIEAAARLRLDTRELPSYFRSAMAACVGLSELRDGSGLPPRQ